MRSGLFWFSLVAGRCASLSLRLSFRHKKLRTGNVLGSRVPLDDPSAADGASAVTQTYDNETVSIPFLDIQIPETSTVKHYNWREFFPRNTSLVRMLRWIITGNTLPSDTQNMVSDGKLQRNLASLARTLLLLRAYEHRFGTPDFGGHAVQRSVLSEITRELYSSGAPVWVLDTVMERVAEGLTGKTGVQYMLLPNRCFIFYPPSSSDENLPQQSAIDMFKTISGFYISKLGAVEKVAVRLASFASNTRSVERLNAAAFRTPRRDELIEIQSRETKTIEVNLGSPTISAEEISGEILDLASSTYGLFFFLNNPKFQAALAENVADSGDDAVEQFWTVSNTTREIFTRLAAVEAAQSLAEIRRSEKVLYPSSVIAIFRSLSAAGACAMWFGGSLSDVLVSSVLAMVVPYVENFRTLASEERILTEVVASFLVGLVAGILALQWPERFCFGAIAVASVMDFLQGFKVCYAAVEVMSRHVVAGAGRLLEGILFTGLIAYSLKSGLDFAFRLMLGSADTITRDYSSMLVSIHGIRECFFPFILPFAATAWSGLFRPSYVDLPLMALHGILAFCLTWAGAPLFMAAATVTLSAGVISRFTGREALGNTLAGLYALVPGTYMVRALLSPSRSDFLERVLVTAFTIGLGSWTGTILCSPVILGKTSGWSFGRRHRDSSKKKQQAMLYF